MQILKATQDTSMTDAQVTALSATMTIDPWIAYYYYDSAANKTRLRATLGWSWSSKPIMQFYDLVAIAWSGGFIQDSEVLSKIRHMMEEIIIIGFITLPI